MVILGLKPEHSFYWVSWLKSVQITTLQVSFDNSWWISVGKIDRMVKGLALAAYNVWRALVGFSELLTQHYEHEMELFSARIILFLMFTNYENDFN